MVIEINNLTVSRIEEDFLKTIAKKVLIGENKKLGVSIALVDQAEMKELNRKYREKNKPVKEDKSSFPPFAAARATDVLSFLYQARQGRAKVKEESGVLFAYGDSGEIVICLPEVRKNAAKFASTFRRELAGVLIHGMLHLLGYDHEMGRRKEKKMEEKQNHYLKLCQRLI